MIISPLGGLLPDNEKNTLRNPIRRDRRLFKEMAAACLWGPASGRQGGAAVTSNPDQRRAERFACESPIVCSSLEGPNVYSARTLNHCESGLSFVTHAPLQAGMTIFFRADTRTQKRRGDSSCRAMRGTGLVQIRWCLALENKERVSYRVGAEYVEPYP